MPSTLGSRNPRHDGAGSTARGASTPGRAGAARPRRRACTVRVVGVALRLVVADDNFLVREGLAALLAEVEEFEVVAMATDTPSLLKAVGETSPDAVLTDIRMPPTYTNEGIEAAKRIRAEHPRRRCGGAVAVRRGGLRLRAAGRRRDRPRLPPQGAGHRRRRAGPGAARGEPGWLGARPEGRGGAGGTQGRRRRTASRSHRPRARGPRRRWRPVATTPPSPRRCS